jgi:hypothetical protein
MKHTRRRNCLLLCVLVLLCSVTFVRAVMLAETAKLVPPETILLIDIDDFSKLQAQFEKTNFYKLYKDPVMTPFFDDLKAKWQEEKKKLDDEYFRIIADVDEFPRGRVAVVLVLDEQTVDANELPVLFITQWGRSIEKIKEITNRFVEKCVEDGTHRKVENERGVDVTILVDESSEALSYCFIDDCLIVSLNLDILKFVVAHIKGAGSPTLADNDDYDAALRSIKYRDGQINLCVNIKQIIRTINAEDTTGKVKTVVSNLGLDNVKSFGCSINVAGGPGGSSSAKAILRIDGAKTGVCKLLDVESAALKTPRFISASVCSVSFMNLNIRKAFDELVNILTAFSPELAAIMYMPLLPESPQGEPSVNLKADIIDYLGSQILIAQSINKSPSAVSGRGQGQAGSEPLVEALLAVAINNRSALERSLSQLHSKILAPDNPDARRQLLGHTLYLIDTGFFMPGFLPGSRTPMRMPVIQDRLGRSANADSGNYTKLAFTITDTHLLFSSESVVERAIRTLGSSETPSVASAEWFRKAKSNIPSSVGLAGLEDVSASAEYLWISLRKLRRQTESGSDNIDVEMGVGMRPGATLPEILFSQGGYSILDFGLLPEFDTVRKYFGLATFYGISRPDGFFFESKYLNPGATD